MGLDMSLYLYYSLYKYGNNIRQYYPKELQEIIKDDGNVCYINKEIYYEVAYWRKANAIHKYFVDKCADGIDECQRIYVNLENLKELVNLCELVLNDHKLAPDLLPTQQGFFFGSYEYDDYYFNMIKYTYDVCSKIITFMEIQIKNDKDDKDDKDDEHDKLNWAIMYRASC